jgi:nucleotide-binding universal stress UspA family protein
MTTARQRILVGVTGMGENTSALRWASERAAATGTSVTLVHVARPVLPPPPPSILMSAPPPARIGRDIVRGVAAEYEAITDGRECATVCQQGSPAHVLSQLSERADLVVVAHRHLPTVRRIVTFSTTISVAAHARCPVVSVPTPWPREASGGEWVTVGVHEEGTPAPVLEAAFEAAALHGRMIRMVHAWRPETGYEDLVGGPAATEHDSQVSAHMWAAAEPLVEKYPDLHVEVFVQHQWPADALMFLQATSALLVVGRHGPVPALPQRIGSIARTLLRGSSCPVMVVPVA